MFAHYVVAHRRWVIATWLLLAVGLAPQARRLGNQLEVTASVRGSEATAVDRAMMERFGSPFAKYAVLVAAGLPSPDTPAGKAVLRQLVATVDTIGGVMATLSYRSANDSIFAPAGGGTFVVVGLDERRGSPDIIVPRLRGATAPLGAVLGRSYPGATLRWTGSAPINFDIRVASANEGRHAEASVLPVTLVLLLLAFGALVAAILPIVAASLAILVALGTAVLINHVWPLSIVLANIASMIGLGVGIDYALLTVGRFREARATGDDVTEAAVAASRHAGSTITLSGAAVCIGFGALLLVPLNELQSVGVGGILVVSSSVLMAVTLLPALLATLGDRVERGRVPWISADGNPMSEWWRAWARQVVARPVLVLMVSAVPLGALAWQARRLNPELPRGNWLPRGIESGLAMGDLIRMHRGGVVNTVRVLVELPPTLSLFDSAGWAAAQRLTAAIAADPRVARVASVTTAFPAARTPPQALALLPSGAQRTLMSRDWRATVIEATPRDSLDFNALTVLARDLRRMDAAAVAGAAGVHVRVGGLPALNADYVDAINSRFIEVVSLVIILTLVALMIGFRSVLIPVKAVALNLLSVVAAYGAVVLVFQDGHGARFVGLDRPLGGVFATIPILVFCVVFGLSMDYEVFLVARIAEARRTMGEHEAVVEGMARTGGIITSAAAIMIAVFAAFTLGQFQFIKVLGFALAVAVFLDATIVRMAVGPALFVLAGRWNWWPGGTAAAGQHTVEADHG